MAEFESSLNIGVHASAFAARSRAAVPAGPSSPDEGGETTFNGNDAEVPSLLDSVGVTSDGVEAAVTPESPEPPKKKDRSSSYTHIAAKFGELLLAIVILGAAIFSTFHVKREDVAHYWPGLAAALKLTDPAQETTASMPNSAAEAHVEVWVDLSTGLYHCAGTPWYGRTRTGRYMQQWEARASNFEPADRKGCKPGAAVLPHSRRTAPRVPAAR